MASESDYTLEDGIPEGCWFERIALDNIEATAATQVRVRIDRKMVDQYTEDLQNGAQMPPLDVFREENSERNILADGFHRHRAAINAKWGDIGCIVHPGGTHEALMFALGTNAEHGFRRTNADKRHAVEMALKDPEMSQLRPAEIADICRVTKRTVNKIINEQLTEDENDSQNGNGSQTEPAEPTDDDVRDTGIEPTQDDVDLEEIRKVVTTINGMAYSGATAAARLALTLDDIGDLELASTWLADAVIVYRHNKKEAEEEGK